MFVLRKCYLDSVLNDELILPIIYQNFTVKFWDLAVGSKRLINIFRPQVPRYSKEYVNIFLIRENNQ